MSLELESVWNAVENKLLYPLYRNPYYISAPPWTPVSAGVRALHLLCHALNRLGLEAYITNDPFGDYPVPWKKEDLFTPILQPSKAEEHLRQGRAPIVVYPEIISGNPLKAPVVVRWVLNFPGLLGGDAIYEASELCFGYSRELALAAGFPDQVLHLPAVDTRKFHPPRSPIQRKGGCFFADKYKRHDGGELNPITKDCIEITRHLPDSQTTIEVAELLRRSEVFYAYENTALAIEALLCGCPAVFLPNAHLTEMIGKEELGSDGYAWGADPAEVARAKATVDQGAINYLKTYDVFWEQLKRFVAITQQRAENTAYNELLNIKWLAPEKPSAEPTATSLCHPEPETNKDSSQQATSREYAPDLLEGRNLVMDLLIAIDRLLCKGRAEIFRIFRKKRYRYYINKTYYHTTKFTKSG